MPRSLGDNEVYDIACKHANETLAQIADHQMTTWVSTTSDTAREIITRQVVEAIKEALSQIA